MQVTERVKHASGIDFKVEHTPWRSTDLARIAATGDPAHASPAGQPWFDHETIAGPVLAWERELPIRLPLFVWSLAS